MDNKDYQEKTEKTNEENVNKINTDEHIKATDNDNDNIETIDNDNTAAIDTDEHIEFAAVNKLSLEDTYDRANVNVVKIKRRGNSAVMVAIIVGLFLLTLILFYVIRSIGSGVDYGSGGPYVGVLYLTGEIQSSESSSYTDSYQHDWMLSQIAYMGDDSLNQGIMLCVNSPGGSVYQSDELYEALIEYKEYTGRPVYAYFAETAASGAYYASMAADVIYANKNTITGSIGVYLGPLIDASQLLGNLGINMTVVKSAENKAMGSYYQSLTDEQLAILQAEVDEFYGRFVDVVAESRHMDTAWVRVLGDGRIYTASQALERGLIDGIGTLQDALDNMSADCGTDGEPVTVRYEPDADLYNSIIGFGGRISEYISDISKSEIETTMEYLKSVNKAEVRYLMN